MPNILIRTDVAGIHGYGHAVRMRALAHALTARGASVSFTTTTPALAAFVTPFPCNIPNPYLPADILVIDTKADDAANSNASLSRVRQARLTVVRIDHPHATPESCDLLVAPVNHWSPETITRLQHTFGARFLYGWDYVMLAPEVTQQPPIPYEQRVNGPIVFCAGGSDPSGALTKMAEWCSGMVKLTDWIFLLPKRATSIPAQYPWATVRPFRREYLREAALIVGMFGVSCYEALWYRTPMLCFAHTDENAQGCALLQPASWGAIQTPFEMRMEHATQEQFLKDMTWVWNPSAREQMHQASEGLIDGLGTQRVAEAILNL